MLCAVQSLTSSEEALFHPKKATLDNLWEGHLNFTRKPLFLIHVAYLCFPAPEQSFLQITFFLWI